MIVGAGVTGLTLAYALSRQGHTPVVVEATDRVGGAIRSEMRDGFWLEWGPSALRGHIPELGWLLEQLHLRDSVVALTRAARRRYVVDTAQVRRSLGPSLLPRLAREPRSLWQGAHTLVQPPWKHMDQIDASQSLHAWVQERYGSFAADTLAQGFCHGLYGADAHTLDARFVLSQPERMRPAPVGERETPKSFWLQHGISALTDALARNCQIHIRSTASLVELLDRYAPIATVLTTPWPATLGLLKDLDIAGPTDAVSHTPMEVHYLVWQHAPWLQNRRLRWMAQSFGLVTTLPETHLLGMHIVSATTPCRAPLESGLIALYCRGGTSPDLALTELTRLTDLHARPDALWSASVQHPMPTAHPGFMPRLADVRARLAAVRMAHSPIYLANSFAGGVGVPSRVRAALHCAQGLTRAMQKHT